MGGYKRGFDMGNFEITKREILASISIIAVLMLFGVLISNKISEYQMDKNEIYNKAAKIENTDLFRYGMNTNIGNAFVYGNLESVDTVTYPELSGEYMYIEKITEQYTMHTRTVETTDDEGNTETHTETYWTWDKIDSESQKCGEISFCEITFDSNKIQLPNPRYITTINKLNNIRYVYYGTGTKFTGTIFTDLRNKTISDNTEFYKDMDIEKTVKFLQCGNAIIIGFWLFWVILIIVVVYVFYYFDNEWLEENYSKK